MHPILLSILLGLTAAAANVFGGAIIVQKNWDRSYLKYFVALGAGFMLATAIIEIFPASLELRGKSAAFLVLGGYLIVHFSTYSHPALQARRLIRMHGHGDSARPGLIIHTSWIGDSWGSLLPTGVGHHLSGHFPTFRRIHHCVGHAGQRPCRPRPSCCRASTLAGVLTMALFRHQVSYGLPLSAGVTIYVAASDLMPEVNREPGVRMALVVFLGVGLLFLLDTLVHVH
jgi:ZIP family zinc transporter/zinc and cadmium transporter